MRFKKRLDDALLTVKIHESMDRAFKAILEGRRHRRDIVGLYAEELRGRGLLNEGIRDGIRKLFSQKQTRTRDAIRPRLNESAETHTASTGTPNMDQQSTKQSPANLYVLNLARQRGFNKQQLEALQQKISLKQPINNKRQTAEDLYASHLKKLNVYVQQIKDYYIQDIKAVMTNLYKGLKDNQYDKNLKNVAVHLGNAVVKAIGTYNPGLASSKPANVSEPEHQSHSTPYDRGYFDDLD